MSEIHTQIIRGDRFIRFTCRGDASLNGYRSIADIIRKEMADPSLVRRVFVDIVGVEGDLAEMDKYSVGEYIAKVLLGIRIGVLMRPKTITRFGENTAVNRGANLLVGADEAELLAWLEAGLSR